MSVIGLIQAFNEEGSLGAAVESLLAAGCERVVVVDGAWANPDGSPFGGGSWQWRSSDRTAAEARGAGALVIEATSGLDDGRKRDWSLANCGAEPGDHLLLLDADERIKGELDLETTPSGHGCIVLRNDKPNDVDDRTPWLNRDIRESVPMLRWLRWSPELRCLAPGRYEESGVPIRAYLTEALAALGERHAIPVALDLGLQVWRKTTSRARFHEAQDELRELEHLHCAALAALRSVEFELPNDRLVALPLVPGVEISHCVEASAARVAAKARYYGAVTA